jgi:hypothetical protein
MPVPEHGTAVPAERANGRGLPGWVVILVKGHGGGVLPLKRQP